MTERTIKRVCVFAGSSPGKRPEYAAAAAQLGKALCARGQDAVFGGSSVGLMGVMADTMLDNGGHVIGVIPEALVAKELAHEGLSELRIVASMHERKAMMVELADAFVALPGGIGTLEEMAEVLTWTQLGIHDKPVGLVNVSGYFDALLAFLSHAVEERFVRKGHSEMIIVDEHVEMLLDRAEQYRAPRVHKWMDRDQS